MCDLKIGRLGYLTFSFQELIARFAHFQVAVGAEGEVVSLLCTATERPSICLWRTPYQAELQNSFAIFDIALQSIYTVGGGRVWEDGRLSSSPGAGPRQCGLVINGLEARDAGAWQCEVGAVVDGEFTTTTAITMVTVVQRGASETGPTLLEGLEGNEAVLPCLSSGGTSATCEWTSPYGTQMSLEPGEYAERGRLLAGDDCSLKVSSLQGRDEGSWICRVGNSQRAISLTIESEFNPPNEIAIEKNQSSTFSSSSAAKALRPDLNLAAGRRAGNSGLPRQQGED